MYIVILLLYFSLSRLPFDHMSVYITPEYSGVLRCLCSIVAQVDFDISKENCVFIFTGQSVPDTPL